MQVAEGVFQFQVLMPHNPNVPGGGLRYTLTYAVGTPQGWILIDAGLNTKEGFAVVQQGLVESGIPPRDVTTIVITHAHPDHAGLANRLKELTGARLLMHRLDAVSFQHRLQAMAQNQDLLRWWMQRYGVPVEQLTNGFLPQPLSPAQEQASPWRFPAPTVDVLLEGGEEIVPGSGLWAIWTPGHSPGHLCVHDRTRQLLFSGDHVLPTITPHVSLFPGDDGNPLGHFLQVQRDLRQLEVGMVYPAHEHPFPDLRQRVDEILEHHRDRMSEILDQVQDGPKTPWQITSGITWNVASWDQLGPWTRRMALMETMAHLQHLAAEGDVTRQETETTLLYRHP